MPGASPLLPLCPLPYLAFHTAVLCLLLPRLVAHHTCPCILACSPAHHPALSVLLLPPVFSLSCPACHPALFVSHPALFVLHPSQEAKGLDPLHWVPPSVITQSLAATSTGPLGKGRMSGGKGAGQSRGGDNVRGQKAKEGRAMGGSQVIGQRAPKPRRMSLSESGL